MPKLWTKTIEAHRQAVRDAAVDAAAALVAEQGLRSVTMSQIAERTGIGRATLYKYFADVEAILAAWHERLIGTHLERLAELREQPIGPVARLRTVLLAYAQLQHEYHSSELVALLHHGEQVAEAHRQLASFVRDQIAEAARGGELRDDVAPAELAAYCLHAVSAAAALPSRTAVQRLVEVTLSGLRPPPRASAGASPSD